MGLGKGNGRGGARPGAGRKKQETLVVQASRRDVVLDVISDPAWRKTVKAWLEMAQTTPSVIYPLIPYLLGAAKQEIDVSGQITHVNVENARQVLRVVGGTDERRTG